MACLPLAICIEDDNPDALSGQTISSLKLFRRYHGRMPNRSREPRAPLAAEAWRRIFDFIATTADQRDRVLERLDLTPGDVRALNSLATGEGKTMASLAREWRCDASTATWLVDRLEKRGFARRETSKTDRRGSLVRVTSFGAATKRRLQAALHKPPPQLLQLDAADLVALRHATSKLPSGPWPAPRAAAELQRVTRRPRSNPARAFPRR